MGVRGVVGEGRRRGSSLGFGSKLSLKIDQRRHSEHRLKVENRQMDNGDGVFNGIHDDQELTKNKQYHTPLLSQI